jgi:hypothetical protein
MAFRLRRHGHYGAGRLLELQNPELKAQIWEGHQAYRRDKTRGARAFLTELRHRGTNKKSRRMPSGFRVLTTPASERDVRSLSRRDARLLRLLEKTLGILEEDPHNRSVSSTDRARLCGER